MYTIVLWQTEDFLTRNERPWITPLTLDESVSETEALNLRNCVSWATKGKMYVQMIKNVQ
jgi:hypothetical protein